MKIDPISPRFEKIFERALERAQNHADKNLRVVGTDSTLALAFFLSQTTSPKLWAKPQLVLLPTQQDVDRLQSEIEFFDPELKVSALPSFDVSPYSGLYPNTKIISARVRWLSEASRPQSRHVFIACIEAVLQRTMPVRALKETTHRFKTGDELPANTAKFFGSLGYQAVPVVEDEGTFAIRGGIVDVFSSFHPYPIRIELFGDQIDSIRMFDPESQRSLETLTEFVIIPPREVLFNDETRERASNQFRKDFAGREVDESDRDSVAHGLAQGQLFPGVDFLVGAFYEEFCSPLDHFNGEVIAWLVNPHEIERGSDQLIETLKSEFADSAQHVIRPQIDELYRSFDQIPNDHFDLKIQLLPIDISDHMSTGDEVDDRRVEMPSQNLRFLPSDQSATDALPDVLNKLVNWRENGTVCFVAASTNSQAQRLKVFLEKTSLVGNIVSEESYLWSDWFEQQNLDRKTIHIIPRSIDDSVRLVEENVIFVRDEDFFGKKNRRREHKKTGTIENRANALAFADLKPGDPVVHTLHGVGIYEGLKVMPIQGVDSEYIQLSYKDGDKLYLPVYRIHQLSKYAAPGGARILDKLGGTQWAKTTSKVKNRLRELALDLLELYAKRSQVHRPPFPANDDDFARFEANFPYDETNDQLKAVDDIIGDLTSDKPMDRLICGDVGFGKTEVAMRGAFKAVQAGKQVAVLAPTTVLTFQHVETFGRRFKNWPITIKALNRFIPNAEAKKTLAELKEGKVDIIIGTHRLLSKDVGFKDLGLMIIDEEQKFGVAHKERIKKMKTAVDTLTLSATPIPRTLNMSLVGMRDLSIINTAPVDRLPTRTFVTKFDEETIRKAVTSEIQRGGQVFFLHNKVQSIYSTADEIRRIVPDARIKVGHGQMEEHELEQTMVSFFNHEIDVLVCTTIIESGIDNPRANTMFIDNSHQFGLSQLYQLRGRVGRSKERAYCYLLIPPNKRLEPDAQERLKIIQENTALGSGFKIAHHDLELRGAGNIIGEDQSGEIDSVGYEMYLELLDEAVRTARGEEVLEAIEPEINVRIPALIPDSYIPDLRIRLSYYRALTEIETPEDVDRLENELRDQFGKLPDQVLNLMGLMLIRHLCRQLGVRDLTAGPKTISLAFTERTPLPPSKVIELTARDNKKYSITPDNRLIVRMNSITWPNIYDELVYLHKLC